jgi:hypothetical protein
MIPGVIDVTVPDAPVACKYHRPSVEPTESEVVRFIPHGSGGSLGLIMYVSWTSTKSLPLKSWFTPEESLYTQAL